MKTDDAPSRQACIDWCRERSTVNRNFNGRLTPAMLVQIRQDWPVYFDTIAYLLERDANKPSAPQSEKP